VTESTDGYVLSGSEYHAVMDAVRRWRAFGMEMVKVFEEQRGRSDPAYQGAIRMVVLADQVLRILGQSEPSEPCLDPLDPC
jgi:hypothetical protein